MSIKVRMTDKFHTEDVRSILKVNNMLEGTFIDSGDNYIEVIQVGSLDKLSSITRQEILSYEQKEDTTYTDMEQKYFFYLDNPGESHIGEFVFGMYISFYEEPGIVGEVDASENDTAYIEWREKVEDFCSKIGWEILT